MTNETRSEAVARDFSSSRSSRPAPVTPRAQQVVNARQRVTFGEGIRTDVDLAEARAFIADEQSAAEARFPRTDRPRSGDPRRRPRPRNGPAREPRRRVACTRAGNPDVAVAQHETEEPTYQVKIAEGQTLPTIRLSGRLATNVR